jgi:hypothetical protein
MDSMNTGICKLCLQEKPLLRKSHIIPEFMYRDLFDEHHKMYKLAPSSYIEGDRRVMHPSSGEYDNDILCEECDNVKLGRLETYAQQAMYGGTLSEHERPIVKDFTTPEGIKFSHVTDLSYQKFKLFLLSILWRASVSGREFFKEVSLGPYEETIRKMLIEDDPRTEDVFPIIMLTWLNDKSSPKDLVGQPGKNRTERGIRYIFIIGGVIYVFYVSPGWLPDRLKPFTLLSANEASLLHVPEGKSWELWKTYFNVK